MFQHQQVTERMTPEAVRVALQAGGIAEPVYTQVRPCVGGWMNGTGGVDGRTNRRFDNGGRTATCGK